MASGVESNQRNLIRRIGFFHFSAGLKTDPVASLKASLMATITSLGKDLADCLIGLREAFNLRCGYWNRTES